MQGLDYCNRIWESQLQEMKSILLLDNIAMLIYFLFEHTKQQCKDRSVFTTSWFMWFNVKAIDQVIYVSDTNVFEECSKPIEEQFY